MLSGSRGHRNTRILETRWFPCLCLRCIWGRCCCSSISGAAGHRRSDTNNQPSIVVPHSEYNCSTTYPKMVLLVIEAYVSQKHKDRRAQASPYCMSSQVHEALTEIVEALPWLQARSVSSTVVGFGVVVFWVLRFSSFRFRVFKSLESSGQAKVGECWLRVPSCILPPFQRL